MIQGVSMAAKAEHHDPQRAQQLQVVQARAYRKRTYIIRLVVLVVAVHRDGRACVQDRRQPRRLAARVGKGDGRLAADAVTEGRGGRALVPRGLCSGCFLLTEGVMDALFQGQEGGALRLQLPD